VVRGNGVRYRNAEGIQQPSPGSRSAPWVTVNTHVNPKGVLQHYRFSPKRTACRSPNRLSLRKDVWLKTRCGRSKTPSGFFVTSRVSQPRVRCATLGFVVQRLRRTWQPPTVRACRRTTALRPGETSCILPSVAFFERRKSGGARCSATPLVGVIDAIEGVGNGLVD